MNPTLKSLSFGLAVAASITGNLSAVQIRVPLDQPTIQQAVNTATNGNVVLVSPGTYNESVGITNKDIVLLSSGGPAVTIIDPLRTNRVLTLKGSMGRSTRVEGFTIKNGQGGILVNGPAATIVNNYILTNGAISGVGIDIEFSSPLVVSNVVAGNYRFGGSGGSSGSIYIGGAAAAEIVHNVITNNGVGGIDCFAAGTPIIRENFISGNTNANSWGGISLVNYADALIINNVITKNRPSGIYSSVPSGNRGPYIINNTIVDNQGTGILSDGFDTTSLIANNIIATYSNYTACTIGNFDTKQPLLLNNDFYAPVGTNFAGLAPNQVGTNGNVSIDPNFISRAAGDLHLGAGSLCINSGESAWLPSGVTNDFDVKNRAVGSVDMGAYEGQSPGSIISYAWLQQRGLPTNGSADYLDTDADGYNTWQEWRADTDPASAASALKITAASRIGKTNTITWLSSNTRTYFVQRGTNLNSVFSLLATNIPGQSGTTTFSDNNAPLSGMALYRVYVR